MRRLVVLLAVALLAGLGAGAAQAKLTQAEVKWVKPLIDVWNVQNAALHLVGARAAAPNALVAGEKPHNLALTKTLYALVICKVPKDLVAKVGAPPSGRLLPFRDALSAACARNAAGANDIAKAIGAVSTKKKASVVNGYLAQSLVQLKQGSAELAKAYKSLVALGGSNIFTA